MELLNRVIIVYTDLTITTEKLMELFAQLDPEKVDKLLGEYYCLGLPQSEMDRIYTEGLPEPHPEERGLPRPLRPSISLPYLEPGCLDTPP